MSRILIVSNNCLSKYNSNGRTLLNLLGGFNNLELCQFYITNEVPTENSCSKFLRITDEDVIRSYCSLKKRYTLWGETFNEQEELSNLKSTARKQVKKTVIKSFVRDFLWNSSKWIVNRVVEFARENYVNLILLQAGDNVFLHRIARKVAQRNGLPLLIYNTEDYYFKEYNYIRGTQKAGFIYKCYHFAFCKEFKKLIKYSSEEVYNCYGLKELYDKTFARDGKVIYAATDLKAVEKVCENGLISYTGNLGCGRHKVLMEVAKALQSISKELYLDIYGPINEKVLAEFNNCEGVRYHGFVSYEEVCKIIRESRLLVHVESFDVYYQTDTRFAFSTKLADYGASNVPVFICAPSKSETSTYMLKYKSAFVAEDPSKISDVLEKALYNTQEREEKRDNALRLSQENNNYLNNGRKFKEIVEGIINVAD